METKTTATDCPHCHASDCVHRPSGWWRVAVGAAWLVLASAVMAASLIGPFILMVGPIVAFSGAGLLSFVHGKAAELPTCSECGKIAQWEGNVVPFPRYGVEHRNAA